MGTFVTYAQNREDVILAAFFKDIDAGTYVDIGAHNPIADSVTKHFYIKGWRGINVEPNPELFKLIESDRTEDINVRAGISSKNGTLRFRIYKNTGLSTFSNEIQKMYISKITERTKEFEDVEVNVITLTELFKAHPLEHVHFLKIDVEGYEYEVLSSNDWNKFRPEVICIEADHKIKDWRPILEKAKYNFVWNDGLNDYYLATESNWRKDNFSYPETILIQDQIIPYHVAERIESLVNEAEQSEVKNQILRIKVESLEEDNKILQKRITEMRRVKSAAKLLVTGLDKAAQAHIESIRAPKKFQHKKETYRYEYTHESLDIKEILNQIQKADLRAFYSSSNKIDSRKSSMHFRSTAYQVLHFLYMTPRKTAALAYRNLKEKN